ncbi:hypothetical protein PGT21_034539 [Puccinia graminis f. sp. tritici]|uniref:Uncharacterized protein n=1 Tax=Puccinia graminis f. sp. tritici TaxID=56615 RepID=A0A5B0NE65_PUCGR|nr:hypothetical protein PGT21_034539 [Puccinia graminis f. sp. tritici]
MPTVFSLRRTYRATATRLYGSRQGSSGTLEFSSPGPFARSRSGPSCSTPRKQPIANEGGDYNPLYNGRVMPNQRSLAVVFDSIAGNLGGYPTPAFVPYRARADLNSIHLHIGGQPQSPPYKNGQTPG